MATVNVAFTMKKQSVPASIVPSGNVRLRLMEAAVVKDTVLVGATTLQGSFAGVPDGTYTVESQRMSMGNEPIGDPSVSASFAVVNTVEIDVPDVVTVTLG